MGKVIMVAKRKRWMRGGCEGHQRCSNQSSEDAASDEAGSARNAGGVPRLFGGTYLVCGGIFLRDWLPQKRRANSGVDVKADGGNMDGCVAMTEGWVHRGLRSTVGVNRISMLGENEQVSWEKSEGI